MIKKTKPLIFPLLKIFFPACDFENVAIVWGDTIYCKSEISEDLKEHELTHIRQNKGSKFWGLIWWIKYILSKKFRLSQELEAYQNQYRFAKKNYRKEIAQNLLNIIAGDLSGELYGNIISFEDAINKIKNG